MLPVVVIAGRPNVGKSTLFNRLAGRRIALVADTPGVTRDRKEAEALLRGRRVTLIDTAGLEEAAPETLAGRMRAGSASAVEQADLVLFVLDARAGVTPADAHFAQWLRRQGKPVLLVANKAEGADGDVARSWMPIRWGWAIPVGVSAEHGDGIADLMSEIADRLPPEPGGGRGGSDADDPQRPLKLAIVGRPNAGKSTLLNRLLGEDRMLTGPEPGLTRDAIASSSPTDDGRPVEIVDTAGLRRRARIEAPLEKMSVSSAIEALKMAEVVVLAIDAVEGIHDQDLQIARLIEREGRACVVVLNKWDAVADRNATRKAIMERLEDSLAQMKGIPGGDPVGADRCGGGAAAAGRAASARGLEQAGGDRRTESLVRVRAGTASAAAGAGPAPEAALRHAGQGSAADIRGVRHAGGTDCRRITQRYLVNSLRETFKLPGTPIRLQLRGTKNPFAED